MMIDTSFITIGSRLASISLGLVTLFLLFEIKSKVTDRLKITFIYFIIADICMITLRAFGIMDELGIWVSTFYDSALVIFSLFLFLSILDFYKFTSMVTKQIDRNISEPEKMREKPQVSLISVNRLKEMEEKLKKVEDRIREGRIKTIEAEKISNKFNMQLSSLNEAYEQGYISKEAYERGRDRIKKMSQELKKKHL
jgi:hypothetical protein